MKNLKGLFCLLVLSLASFKATAVSNMRPLSAGTYSFYEFSVSSILRTEIVYGSTVEGQERLRELRQAGQTCIHSERGTHRCSIHEDPAGREFEIEALVSKKFGHAVVVLGPLRRPPTHTHSSHSYVEYLVPQSVSAFGDKWEKFRYWLMRSSDLHKMTLGNPAEAGFLINPDASLTFLEDFRVHEDRSVLRIYTVHAVFRP